MAGVILIKVHHVSLMSATQHNSVKIINYYKTAGAPDTWVKIGRNKYS